MLLLGIVTLGGGGIVTLGGGGWFRLLDCYILRQNLAVMFNYSVIITNLGGDWTLPTGGCGSHSGLNIKIIEQYSVLYSRGDV
jgi:hypothetical protein